MKLMDYLPDVAYHGEEHIQDYQDAVQTEIDQMTAERDDLLRQMRPSTATWGMAIYEREYGLATDESRPPEQRLARWRAKRRGQGTTTQEMLAALAAGFSGGLVKVTEQARQYLIVLYFIGTRGAPPGEHDLRAAIREVLPAHLDYQLIFRYNTHGELRRFTHAQLRGRTHRAIREEEL